MFGNIYLFIYLFIYLYFYIYSSDLQESVGGAIHYNYQANAPTCFGRSQDIAVLLKLFIVFFSFIRLKI